MTTGGDDPVTAAERDWPGLLEAVLGRRDLTSEDTAWAMEQVMRGAASPARLAGMLVALRAKGETVEEVRGLVDGLRAHAVPLHVPGPTLDIVGTGGDGADTVNISTMAAVVAAGAGARVVKHGNRSASSACGSADVLERLGVVLTLPPRAVADVAEEAGITFCFAPHFHPAMRHAAPTRRELGIPTVFNLLGPLSNPAAPTAQAVGTADARTAPLIAGVLALRGTAALVFRGDDGLDELTVTTTSKVWSVQDGTVREETFDPLDAGIARAHRDELRGGGAEHNAQVVRALLAGERGAVRDAVLLSAAAGLSALRPSPLPVAERIARELGPCAKSIDSGAAADVLERWVALTGKHAAAADAAPGPPRG
ncbi:anthranilate phosphoribosyltransferase [Streptomyces sp. TRM68367]|uniref:anthranilate phosphoribosyltransferase n=1 Tax=Streptomyces sp. TRM68367 TaxID=2758415 RepID=UPI00165B7A5B|nr:anthranilate phosphoribosyltransferase [Streptomyces sp. TRM68367]MBC9727093.1 anthranilate phosphoribosyltransferase [Streptomyces sp. TRM68367]